MNCPDERPWCLADHVLPRLDRWSRSGERPDQYKALCPVRKHGDSNPSLSIGIGDRGQVEWTCFAGCDRADIRAELVRRGVPDGCLRRVEGQRTEDELVSALTVILETEPPGARRDLLLAATAWGRGKIPHGQELEQLADRTGVSRTTAYRVTAKSQSGTPRNGYPVTARSRSETSSPNVGPNRFASTSGFGAAVTGGVENRVKGEAPPLSRGPLAVTDKRCDGCGSPLDPDSRADRRHCSATCRQAAWRARRHDPARAAA